MSTEEAKKIYDKAREDYVSAYADLRAARIHLDETLGEQEAARYAVMGGSDGEDPSGTYLANNVPGRGRGR